MTQSRDELAGLVGKLLSKQRARQQRKEIAKGCLKLVALVASLGLTPWLFMLALGVLHTNGIGVPALGFWESWLVLLGISVVTGRMGKAVTSAKESWKKTRAQQG